MSAVCTQCLQAARRVLRMRNGVCRLRNRAYSVHTAFCNCGTAAQPSRSVPQLRNGARRLRNVARRLRTTAEPHRHVRRSDRARRRFRQTQRPMSDLRRLDAGTKRSRLLVSPPPRPRMQPRLHKPFGVIRVDHAGPLASRPACTDVSVENTRSVYRGTSADLIMRVVTSCCRPGAPVLEGSLRARTAQRSLSSTRAAVDRSCT
jgi:hypothetical protein